MKTIIIDDERLARKELRDLLHSFPEIEVVEECASGNEAVEAINKLRPDLIFMDIEMPGKTGFDVLQDVDVSPRVVFVTAHDEFAVKAFEVNALDYLLKPVDPKRLEETVRKIIKDHAEAGEGANGNPREAVLTEDDQVFVKDGDKCWFVKLSDVRLFESEGNYVRVYFNTNRPLILKSLNALEERLSPKAFFRASRKHIVNLKWVDGIENWFNGGLMVRLKGGEQVEISRRQSTKFKEMMSL